MTEGKCGPELFGGVVPLWVRHRLQYVGVNGPELFGGVFRMCSCSNVFGMVSGIIRWCSDVFESGTPPPPPRVWPLSNRAPRCFFYILLRPRLKRN